MISNEVFMDPCGIQGWLVLGTELSELEGQ